MTDFTSFDFIQKYKDLSFEDKNEYFRFLTNFQDLSISDIFKKVYPEFRFFSNTSILNSYIFPDYDLIVANKYYPELKNFTNIVIGDYNIKLINLITYKLSKIINLINIFMQTAFNYSSLSTCNRLKVGAVLVKDGRIIATGTNGSPSRLLHCKDVGCKIINNHCLRTVHAEKNLILFCLKERISMYNTSVFCTDFPCYNCLQLLYSIGVRNIYFQREYVDGYNKSLSKEIDNQIKFFKYIPPRTELVSFKEFV